MYANICLDQVASFMLPFTFHILFVCVFVCECMSLGYVIYVKCAPWVWGKEWCTYIYIYIYIYIPYPPFTIPPPYPYLSSHLLGRPERRPPQEPQCYQWCVTSSASTHIPMVPEGNEGNFNNKLSWRAKRLWVKTIFLDGISMQHCRTNLAGEFSVEAVVFFVGKSIC